MTRQEIGQQIFGDEFDRIKFYNHFGKQKRRYLEREDKKIRNEKVPVEDTKKVAMRLRKKLIEPGKTPNLDGRFFLEKFIIIDIVTPRSY